MAANIKGITIEIGGSTTKLTEALKEPIAKTKDLRSSLLSVNKQLKFDPKNVELLDQKQRVLGKTIAATKDELAILKEAQRQYIDSGKDLDGGEYIALKEKIQLTEKALENLQKQQSNFSGELQALGKAAGDFGAKAEKVGGALTKNVTAPIVGVGAAVVGVAASFDSSMSQVQATMGITKDATSELNGETVKTMDALGDLAQQMGTETKFSASECADAINYLALAGYDTEKIYGTLPTVLDLASAGNMDLARASDMVTDAMSALSINVHDADSFVDQLAKTSSTTNTSVEQLGDAILKIGGTAKTLSGGTTELNTALGILANSGLKGAEGGTALRNAILSLSAPTDKAKKLMDELGVSAYDSEGNFRPLNDSLGDLKARLGDMDEASRNDVLSTLFNKNDLKAINTLLDGTGDSWKNLEATIADSTGAAGQMADAQLDNLSGQMTLLKSALEGLAISFGEILMPIVRTVVEKIQGFVDKLNAMDDATKKSIVKFAALAAAAGPVILAVGKMSTGVFKMIDYFGKTETAGGKLLASLRKLWGGASIGTGAFLAIVAAVAAVVGAFVTLWNTSEDFRDTMIGIWDGIKEKIDNFCQGVVDRINSLGFEFSDITEVISATWMEFCNLLAPVFETAFALISNTIGTCLDLILGIFDFFKAAFTGDWSGMWDAVCSIFTTLWDGISTYWSTLLDGMKGVCDVVLGWFGTSWDETWNTIKTTVTGIWDSISSTASNTWNSIKTTASNVWNGIKSAIETPINNAKNIVKNAIDAIKGFFNFQIKWPHIPLPHFSISGSANPLDWLKGGLPKIGIEWYAKAMDFGQILNSPTIFGLNNGKLLAGGEAGPEAVVGVSSLNAMIQASVMQAFDAQGNLEMQMVGAVSNKLDTLIALLSDNRPVSQTVELPVYLDGREISRGTAKYMNADISAIARLNAKLGGAR